MATNIRNRANGGSSQVNAASALKPEPLAVLCLDEIALNLPETIAEDPESRDLLSLRKCIPFLTPQLAQGMLFDNL